MVRTGKGYWGPITANYDWCETNYKITYYVAEFFNALSSWTIILAGIYFWRLSNRHQYGTRFKLAAIATWVIGVGSCAFHATLQRWGQVLDEVPMLWSALIFLYICIMSVYWTKEQEERYGPFLSGGLTTIAIVVTYIYLQGGFAFFIITYSLTVFAISALSLMAAERSIAGKYAWYAVSFYLGGSIFLWFPEQLFCGNRLEVHHESGLLALPIPLHAFFHVTSAIGPVCYLTFTVAEHLLKRKRKPVIQWHSSYETFGIPAPVCIPMHPL